jgi:hypothetical protein
MTRSRPSVAHIADRYLTREASGNTPAVPRDLMRVRKEIRAEAKTLATRVVDLASALENYAAAVRPRGFEAQAAAYEQTAGEIREAVRLFTGTARLFR